MIESLILIQKDKESKITDLTSQLSMATLNHSPLVAENSRLVGQINSLTQNLELVRKEAKENFENSQEQINRLQREMQELQEAMRKCKSLINFSRHCGGHKIRF